MRLGLAKALLEPIKFDDKEENMMRCLLHIIDSRITSSQYGVLVYSAINSFGPDLFDNYFKKIHETKNFPILYAGGIVGFNLRVDSFVIFLNEDSLPYLKVFLSTVMLTTPLNGDTTLVIVNRYKTSDNKSAFNYTTELLQGTWIFVNSMEYSGGGRIANTIVLVKRYNSNIQEPTSIDVYGWIPQEQTDPCVKSISKVKLLDTWSPFNNSFTSNAELFPNKQMKYFRDCNMKIQIDFFEYLLLKGNNYNFDPRMSPIYRILKAISEFSNLSVSEIHNFTRDTSSHTFFGIYDVAVVLLLQEGFINHTLNPYLLNIFDPMFLQIEVLKFYVPTGAHSPTWQGLIRIFSAELWIVVITAHFLISLIHFLLKRQESKDSMIT